MLASGERQPSPTDAGARPLPCSARRPPATGRGLHPRPRRWGLEGVDLGEPAPDFLRVRRALLDEGWARGVPRPDRLLGAARWEDRDRRPGQPGTSARLGAQERPGLWAHRPRHARGEPAAARVRVLTSAPGPRVRRGRVPESTRPLDSRELLAPPDPRATRGCSRPARPRRAGAGDELLSAACRARRPRPVRALRGADASPPPPGPVTRLGGRASKLLRSARSHRRRPKAEGGGSPDPERLRRNWAAEPVPLTQGSDPGADGPVRSGSRAAGAAARPAADERAPSRAAWRAGRAPAPAARAVVARGRSHAAAAAAVAPRTRARGRSCTPGQALAGSRTASLACAPVNPARSLPGAVRSEAVGRVVAPGAPSPARPQQAALPLPSARGEISGGAPLLVQREGTARACARRFDRADVDGPGSPRDPGLQDGRGRAPGAWTPRTSRARRHYARRCATGALQHRAGPRHRPPPALPGSRRAARPALSAALTPPRPPASPRTPPSHRSRSSPRPSTTLRPR